MSMQTNAKINLKKILSLESLNKSQNKTRIIVMNVNTIDGTRDETHHKLILYLISNFDLTLNSSLSLNFIKLIIMNKFLTYTKDFHPFPSSSIPPSSSL